MENFNIGAMEEPDINGPVDDAPVLPTAPPSNTYDAVYYAVLDALTASQSVTDGQAVSSAALDYFQGVLMNESPFMDYVVYCGEPYEYNVNGYSQTAYEYCMAYGDLDCSGTTFTGLADIVTIRTKGDYSVNYVLEQSINLDAPYYYSRSNLGDYAGIIQKDYTGVGLITLLAIGGIICFLDRIFGFKWH